MSRSLTAIQTQYKGYRFRSRLEARWAVFLDTVRISFQYENQGYSLSDGTWYLPDFETRWGLLEVKPRGAEMPKELDLLSRAADRPAFMIAGDPWPGEYEVVPTAWTHARFDRRSAYEPHGWEWAFCEEGITIGFKDGKCLWGHPLRVGATASLMVAFTKARSARFEYGETPHGRPRTVPVMISSLLCVNCGTTCRPDCPYSGLTR